MKMKIPQKSQTPADDKRDSTNEDKLCGGGFARKEIICCNWVRINGISCVKYFCVISFLSQFIPLKIMTFELLAANDCAFRHPIIRYGLTDRVSFGVRGLLINAIIVSHNPSCLANPSTRSTP